MDKFLPPDCLNSLGFIDYKWNGDFPWGKDGLLVIPPEMKSLTNVLSMAVQEVKVRQCGLEVPDLGRVSIVNKYGYCVYDSFVKPNSELIVSALDPDVNGLSKAVIENATPIDVVVATLGEMTEDDRILVGHGIDDILSRVGIWADVHDIQRIYKDLHPKDYRNLLDPSFEELVNRFVPELERKGPKSSILDAQISLRLYLNSVGDSTSESSVEDEDVVLVENDKRNPPSPLVDDITESLVNGTKDNVVLLSSSDAVCVQEASTQEDSSCSIQSNSEYQFSWYSEFLQEQEMDIGESVTLDETKEVKRSSEDVINSVVAIESQQPRLEERQNFKFNKKRLTEFHSDKSKSKYKSNLVPLSCLERPTVKTPPTTTTQSYEKNSSGAAGPLVTPFITFIRKSPFPKKAAEEFQFSWDAFLGKENFPPEEADAKSVSGGGGPEADKRTTKEPIQEIAAPFVAKGTECLHDQYGLKGRQKNKTICLEEVEVNCKRELHRQIVKCWQATKGEIGDCREIVSKKLCCGHEAEVACSDKTTPRCVQKVQLKCRAGLHYFKNQVPCHEVKSPKIEHRQNTCSTLVWKKLPCGHVIQTACCIPKRELQCSDVECTGGPQASMKNWNWTWTTTEPRRPPVAKIVKCAAGLHDQYVMKGRIPRDYCCEMVQVMCKRGLHNQIGECWRAYHYGNVGKQCNGIVLENLPCGHQMGLLCAQQNFPLCEQQVQLKCNAGLHDKILPCHVAQDWKEGKKGNLVCHKEVWKSLPCGHLINVPCSQKKMTQCADPECLGRSAAIPMFVRRPSLLPTPPALLPTPAESDKFVFKRLDCGHLISVSSYLRNENNNNVGCIFTNKCAHGIPYPCDMEKRLRYLVHHRFECEEPCAQMLPCGHGCQFDCHESSSINDHSPCCTHLRENEEDEADTQGGSFSLSQALIVVLVYVCFNVIDWIYQTVRRQF